jgi:uncharacterized protein YdgA (DUF945 family)
MKKIWIAVVALPVIAYPATSWYLGTQVQAAFDQQYAQAEQMPYLKVVERHYERGLFSATESVTIELFGDMTRALAQARTEGGADTPATEPLRIRFESDIRHGPWADGLAAAVIDSRLVLPEAARAQAEQLFGDQPPLRAHTVVGFDGGGISDVASPAFAAPLPAVDGGEPGQLAWEGITGRVEFSDGMSRYRMQASAPRFEVRDGKGVHMVMRGLALDGEQQRILPDEPLLYAGSQRFTLEEVQVTGPDTDGAPVQLKQIEYRVDMPANGDYLDMKAAMSAQVFQVGAQDFGPAHYDFSMNHLHVATFARLYRALLDMYADPALLAGEGDPQQAMAALAEPAMALLGHDPELRLDRLSFSTPQGEARLQAQARMPGLASEEIGNPMVMLGKLDASGSLSVPEAVMRDLMVARTRNELAQMDPGATLDENQLAMVDAQLDLQLQQAAAEGYIRRDGGLIRAEFAFRDGRLTVNGQPFQPRR